MWALSTRGEPNEIKKNTHSKKIAAFFPARAVGVEMAVRADVERERDRDGAVARADDRHPGLDHARPGGVDRRVVVDDGPRHERDAAAKLLLPRRVAYHVTVTRAAQHMVSGRRCLLVCSSTHARCTPTWALGTPTVDELTLGTPTVDEPGEPTQPRNNTHVGPRHAYCR